jgi:hypothetical protein
MMRMPIGSRSSPLVTKNQPATVGFGTVSVSTTSTNFFGLMAAKYSAAALISSSFAAFAAEIIHACGMRSGSAVERLPLL